VPPVAAEPSGPDADPVALAALVAQYPLDLPSDFQHDPSITQFRALAARHKITPEAAQELVKFHAAEMRRIALVV
jgi:hypothetical protein